MSAAGSVRLKRIDTASAVNVPSRISLYTRAITRLAIRGAKTSLEAPLDSPPFRVPVQAKLVEAFCILCGLPSGQVPLPYLFVLANDPQLALLNRRDCPYGAAGLVQRSVVLEWTQNATHSDDFAALSPAALAPGILVQSQLTDLGEATGGGGRDIRLKSTLATQDGMIFGTVVADYRVRSGKPRQQAAKSHVINLPEGAGHALYLPAGRGRAYAQVSGDWNPIHLSPVTARLFGFRSPIAHGIDVLSCALASAGDFRAKRIEARFRRPVSLPNRTIVLTENFGEHSHANKNVIVVSADRKTVHLTATIN